MATTKKPNGKTSAVERTTTGLRSALFDELDALRSGASNPTRANAVAKLAGSAMETVRLEMDVESHLAKMAGQAKLVNQLASGPKALALE